jgi:hypothetical protein
MTSWLGCFSSLASIWGFISGEFMVSTVLFAGAAIYSNMAGVPAKLFNSPQACVLPTSRSPHTLLGLSPPFVAAHWEVFFEPSSGC